MSAESQPASKPVNYRWFYAVASGLLLVLTVVGFRHFTSNYRLILVGLCRRPPVRFTSFTVS